MTSRSLVKIRRLRQWLAISLLVLAQVTTGATYELDCRSAEAPRFNAELSVGDRLTLLLPDNALFNLELVEESPSEVGGEAFTGRIEGSDGFLTATAVKDRNGWKIAFVSPVDGHSYVIRSTARGLRVRKANPADFTRRPSPSRIPVRKPPSVRKRQAVRRAQNGDPVTVDVMVAYDQGAMGWLAGEDQDAETFALSAVARMNAALANTGLTSAFRFRLVGVLPVNARSGDIDAVLDAVTEGVGAWSTVSEYRDEVGADIVTTLVDTGSASGMTGLSWSLTDEYGTGDYSWFADSAYSVCSIRSVEISHTMTHEVGHNMGAGHSDLQSSQAGPQLFDYSSGYYFTVNGRSYHTIMAYYTDGRTNTFYEEVPFFSSPLHTYEGIAVGDATHDNTLTLRQTFEQVAAFRAARTEPAVDEPDVALARPVVFLHGWNSDGGIWEPLQKLLVSDAGYSKADFRTYSYYQLERGFDTDTPIGTLAAAVAERILADVPEGEFDVVAHSMGGLVLRSAIYDGLIDPARIGHFITLGTPHYGELIGIPGFSSGTETHQMALGSSFLWNLAYDWHFLRHKVDATLCIVGVAGKDLITGALCDGLVPAYSAVLADSHRLYVKRYHADLFSLFGKVIYACEDGAKDSVYRAIRAFLLEDRALTQTDIGWNPDSDVTTHGALFYRVAKTACGEAFAYDKDERRIADGFYNRDSGKWTDTDACFHGGKGYYGAPLGLEMTLGDLRAAAYDVRLATPAEEKFVVENVPVTGGRVGLVEFGADGTVQGDGLYPVPVPPPQVQFWKKATTVSVACDSNSGFVGIGQVKIGKMNKSGVVKVSATFTPFGGKKVSAKSKSCTVEKDGTFEVEWPDVKGLGRVALAIAPVEAGAVVSGTFAEYGVSAAKVGGSLPIADFDFALGDLFEGEMPNGTLTELLPTNEIAHVSGGKWKFAKAAKVKWAKVKGTKPAVYELVVDASKGRTNLSGLSVSYTAKTGLLKGSFKVYALVESNGKFKLKKHNVTLAGALIDGVGRGTASVKKPRCVWGLSVSPAAAPLL